MKIALILLLSSLSGFLYRLGGSGKADTKARDVGCALCLVAGLWILGYHTYWLILTFFLQFGALTTYNKWFGKIFGRKDNDVHWESWFLTGLTYSLAILPAVWGDWLGFGIRSAVLTIGITLWSQFIGNVVWEESGRGALIVGTLLILLIS